jgi:hypothetical protein
MQPLEKLENCPTCGKLYNQYEYDGQYCNNCIAGYEPINLCSPQSFVEKISECKNISQLAGVLSTHAGFSDKHPDYALSFVEAIRSACNPTAELLEALEHLVTECDVHLDGCSCWYCKARAAIAAAQVAK